MHNVIELFSFTHYVSRKEMFLSKKCAVDIGKICCRISSQRAPSYWIPSYAMFSCGIIFFGISCGIIYYWITEYRTTSFYDGLLLNRFFRSASQTQLGWDAGMGLFASTVVNGECNYAIRPIASKIGPSFSTVHTFISLLSLTTDWKDCWCLTNSLGLYH